MSPSSIFSSGYINLKVHLHIVKFIWFCKVLLLICLSESQNVRLCCKKSRFIQLLQQKVRPFVIWTLRLDSIKKIIINVLIQLLIPFIWNPRFSHLGERFLLFSLSLQIFQLLKSLYVVTANSINHLGKCIKIWQSNVFVSHKLILFNTIFQTISWIQAFRIL